MDAILNNLGKRYLLAMYAKVKISTNLKIAIPRILILNPLIVVKTDKANIATMSSVSKIPVMIFPCKLFNSRRSERIFNTTMVDEKLIIKPM